MAMENEPFEDVLPYQTRGFSIAKLVETGVFPESLPLRGFSVNEHQYED